MHLNKNKIKITVDALKKQIRLNFTEIFNFFNLKRSQDLELYIDSLSSKIILV
jgi:hypothetical protein